MYMPSRQLPSKFDFFSEPSGQLSKLDGTPCSCAAWFWSRDLFYRRLGKPLRLRENSLLLLNHSDQKENQSQLGRTKVRLFEFLLSFHRFRVTSTFSLIDRYHYLNDVFREINWKTLSSYKSRLPYSFKCINSNFFCVKCWVKIFITLFVRYMKKLLSSDWSR